MADETAAGDDVTVQMLELEDIRYDSATTANRSPVPSLDGSPFTPQLTRKNSVMRKGMPELQGVMVSFKDLTYTVKAKKKELTLLDNLTGFFKSGHMTALVGPSGSGKTTLLDVLAGRKTAGHTSGTILYGNEPPTKAFLRRHTGYVEQFGAQGMREEGGGT
mmetsp:Transcript_26363/g.74143  ORF Transcript_26363/g.74143 Transcript_26363/m.74143 type:complete len:162 (-) Transcript_26363:2028-2513(-)